MLAKPILNKRPPIFFLLLTALALSMLVFSQIQNFVQQSVSEAPVPPTKVLDADTERRLANIETQVIKVQKLQEIYGLESPVCESLPSAQEYQACHRQHRLQLMQAAMERRAQIEEAARAASTQR